MTSKNTFIICTPITHSLAIKIFFISFILGTKLIIINKFTSKKWIEIVRQNKNCVSFLTSFQLKNLLINKFYTKINDNNLDKMISCADNLETDVKKKLIMRLKNRNFKIFDTYGTTETDGISSYNIFDKNYPINSVGKINKNYDVKILNGNNVLKDNSIGDIYCKSPFICLFKQKSQTLKTHLKQYYYTGDQGYLIKNKLFFSGREKNKIIVSGVNIYSEKNRR